jgi:K+-transporting ATPase ATPase C chain
MRSLMRPALVFVALMTLLTGVLYPAAITGLAQLLFPSQANGSLVVVDGTARGSRLVGQPFSAPVSLVRLGHRPQSRAASSGLEPRPQQSGCSPTRWPGSPLRAADSTLTGPVPGSRDCIGEG